MAYKTAIMELDVSVGGEIKHFQSPVAETILAQVKDIVVGHEQVRYYDDADKKHKSFTYCCGDYFAYNYSIKEWDVECPEIDCCGFPITYEGDK